MYPPSENRALPQVAARLVELVGSDRHEVRPAQRTGRSDPDAVMTVGSFEFVVEWTNSGSTGPVTVALEKLRRYLSDHGGGAPIPLVAVPFMSTVGRQRCAEAEVAWIDLSGNARIVAPGFRVLVEGKPNLFKRPGRPSSVFAPKSSRITRWLLMHPHDRISQRELARATDTDEGYTSRIVRRLVQDGLVIREIDGTIVPRDPGLLLDAWSEAYDFEKHHLIRGHVAARTGDLLLRQLTANLERTSIEYAATGLAAAWLMDRFAGFRITTVYLAEPPPSELLDSLSFREDPRGANTWLVVPNDEGVFHGTANIDGIRCANAVQVYLDLHAHPERAKEAAERLRTTHLSWSTDG